ncbi:hypothetical protein [Streptomyces sp. cg36]|uniref:hypothetical protein n=1 Tax=Streptomyces sp. cg36 TaxID=3238798 RepID=UPI0034E2F20B
MFCAENPPARTLLEEEGLHALVVPGSLKSVTAEDSSPRADQAGVSAQQLVAGSQRDASPD